MRFKTYSYWAFYVGIAFFSIYPLMNWVSSKRADIHQLYLSSELSIPLIPEFIWVYISMYILFILPPFFLNVSELQRLGKNIIFGTVISGVVFLLFPSQLGFERIVPDGIYADMFNRIFSLDLPYNMAPSLHVVYSGFILLAIFDAQRSKLVRIVSILWLVMIMASTIFVHQHHIVDIVLALAVIFLVKFKSYKGKKDV